MNALKGFACIAAIAACGMLGVSAPARAGQMLLGVTGGMAMPTGDFGDAYSGGFHFALSGDYLPMDQIGLGVDLGYNHNNMKDDILNALEAYYSQYYGTSVSLEDKATILQYGLHAKWMPPISGSPVVPYIQAGVAMYNVKEEATASVPGASASDSFSENKAGISGAFGLNFRATSQYQIGVGTAFHNIFTEGKSTTFMNFGVNVAYLFGTH